jgi:hypothetical protein
LPDDVSARLTADSFASLRNDNQEGQRPAHFIETGCSNVDVALVGVAPVGLALDCGGCGDGEQAGEQEDEGHEEERDAGLVEVVPADAVSPETVVGVLRVHAGDAIVDRHKQGDGEQDDACPEDGGHEEEEPGAGGDGAMLEGGAEDEDKGHAVPGGHGFAEGSCEQGGGLGVGAVFQLAQLRMDEGGDGELVADHESGYGCGRDVVGNGHMDWMWLSDAGFGMLRIAGRIDLERMLTRTS